MDTYTPCTSEELPSLAVKDVMTADRSALVAGRAEETAANTAVTGVTAITMSAETMRAAGTSELSINAIDGNGPRRA